MTPQLQPSDDPQEPDQNPNRGCLIAALVFILALGVVVGLLIFRGDGGLSEPDWASLIYLMALLAVISAGFGGMISRNAGQTLRHFGIWIAVAGVVALSYLFHQEAEVILQSFAGRLDPASVQENDGGIVVFAQEDNHFYVRAEVDGRDLIFLIDTGASEVVLSHKDDCRITSASWWKR